MSSLTKGEKRGVGDIDYRKGANERRGRILFINLALSEASGERARQRSPRGSEAGPEKASIFPVME